MSLIRMIVSLFLSTGIVGAAEPVCRLGIDPATGMSEAVVVEDTATWHTSRIVAEPDATGQRPTGLAEQTRSVLKQVDAIFGHAAGEPSQLIRLNISLASGDAGPLVRKDLEAHFPSDQRPVVTMTGSLMPEKDVLIAVDALGVIGVSTATALQKLTGQGASCPAGPKIYISGKAAVGDLATGTRETLRQIDDNLKLLGLNKTDIVQLRAFIGPVSEVDAFHAEVRRYLGDLPLPSVTSTHWISAGYPIEIEAVVKDTLGSRATEIEFITPPGETASPVFCRVVRVPAGPLIYTTGLTGEAGTDSAAQVTRIFERLKPILEQSGSDLRHLAKATYFCADDASSTALNTLRPTLYDPERPPAASKAIVTHIGLPGRVISLDLIAVPTNSTQSEH